MSSNPNVIDNKEVYLSKRLNEQILPNSKNADIVVGYFFISGFGVIVEQLKKMCDRNKSGKIRILISNRTNKRTKEALQLGFHNIKEIEKMIENNTYHEGTKEDILKEAMDYYNKSVEYIEQTKENQNTINTLLEMMIAGKLEIKIYEKEKLHAKAYLFDRESSMSGPTEGFGIVGSSNLSKAGLYENSELNLVTQDWGDISAIKEWFEDLWKHGIESTDNFITLFSRSWAGTERYSAKTILRKAIYDEYKNKISDKDDVERTEINIFKDLYPYQKSAVNQAIQIVDEYNGVIIADVVGMGKTFVGLALLKYLQQEEGYSPLIICPPVLKDMWEKGLEMYEIEAAIVSSGRLSTSDESEFLVKDYLKQGRDLVLIDESHNFRNENSMRFDNLNRYMKKSVFGGKYRKGILLTATPLANQYKDIRNQIQLFQPHYPDTNIPPANLTDLESYFGSISRKGEEEELVNFLQKILVRRTRKYLIDTWGKTDDDGRKYIEKYVGMSCKESEDDEQCESGGKEKTKKGTCVECKREVKKLQRRNYFPERILHTVKYDIDKTYKGKFEDIIDAFYGLELIRYNYGKCIKPAFLKKKLKSGKSTYEEWAGTGGVLKELYKYILLKRMESSPSAFKKTIEKQIKITKIHLEVINDGNVPTEKIYQYSILDKTNIHDIDDEDAIQDKEALIDDNIDPEAFDFKCIKKYIKNDLKLLDEIHKLLPKQPELTDDKLRVLGEMLDHKYKDKKILIFTQYTDTAEYIFKKINWGKIKVEQVDSGKNVLKYARKFDAENNPNKYGNIEKNKPGDEIDVLVTTDVLSEGVNLQAGEVVINYDFHWNPVKLIQRMGRIDRIGSKNEEIFCTNFLAADKIEDEIGINSKVQEKIDKMQKVIGTDSRILRNDEEINPDNPYVGVIKKVYDEDENVFDEIDDKDPLSPTGYEKELRELQEDDSKWNIFMQIPDGIRNSVYAESDGKLLITFVDGDGNNQIKKSYSIDGKTRKVEEINSKHMYEILEYNKDKKTVEFSKETYNELISWGIKKFEKDVLSIKQNKNKNVKKNRLQVRIIRKLAELERENELDEEDYKKVKNLKNKLRKRKITLYKFINKELRKLIDDDNLSNKEFLDKLNLITKDMTIEISDEEVEIKKPPRILYSEYFSDENSK